MANQKNVEALRALIEEWECTHRGQVEASLAGDSVSQLRLPGAAERVLGVPPLWEFLAARGVLVPSAPTEEDATHFAQIATEVLDKYDAGPKTPGTWIGEWRLSKGQSIVVAREERQAESGRFRLYVAPLNGKVREADRPLNWSKLRDQRGAYLAALLADTRQELGVEA
jgi:hypothetical protein